MGTAFVTGGVGGGCTVVVVVDDEHVGGTERSWGDEMVGRDNGRVPPDVKGDVPVGKEGGVLTAKMVIYTFRIPAQRWGY